MTQVPATMKTVKDLLGLCSGYLQERGVGQPRRCAEELIGDILGVERLELYMDVDRPVQEDELQRCRQGLRRLGEREPWQYVRGNVEFYGCKIKVTPDVLIPRNETEILVDKIVKRIEQRQQPMTVWDVCCGSGAIGIALKKKISDATVVMSDISESALSVAKTNAAVNQTAVEFRCGDLLAPFSGEQADVIVCNPPYISAAEYDRLDSEVRDYEPKGALVAGETGLEVYERLAEAVARYLRPGGELWLELGTGQGEAVAAIFAKKGLPGGQVEKDWSGHDRFFLLEIR